MNNSLDRHDCVVLGIAIMVLIATMTPHLFSAIVGMALLSPIAIVALSLTGLMLGRPGLILAVLALFFLTARIIWSSLIF